MVSTISSSESQLRMLEATKVKVMGPTSPGAGMYMGCSAVGSTKVPAPPLHMRVSSLYAWGGSAAQAKLKGSSWQWSSSLPA